MIFNLELVSALKVLLLTNTTQEDAENALKNLCMADRYGLARSTRALSEVGVLAA